MSKKLPPELQWLFMELDSSLKGMGVDGVTPEEALFLANTLLSAPGMLKEKRRADHITPGRAYRKTPQLFLEAHQEFEASQPLAQEPAAPQELKIGSRGVSVAPGSVAQGGAGGSSIKKAPQDQAQQNWALKNRILDLEKQLVRAQTQAARIGEEGQRLAELNLATSVESHEVLVRTQRLDADLKRANDALARRESENKTLEAEKRNLEKNLAQAEQDKIHWESGYKKLELEKQRLEAERKSVGAQAQALREQLDAETSARSQFEKKSRNVESASKDLATQLDEVEKDKLQFKEAIEKLEQEVKRLENERKEERETHTKNLANLETKLNSQIESIRKQKDDEEKLKIEAQGALAEAQHQLKRVDLRLDQDKSSQVSEHEALLRRMKESFDQELQQNKQKAASELEALTKKGASELDAMTRKHSEEAALRVEAEKKAQQLENDLRDVTAKFAQASKALAREEDLRTRLSVDMKSSTKNLEQVMAEKEQQFSSELVSLRNKVEKDAQAKIALENDIASKQMQLNDLTVSTSKQIHTLTQKLEEQSQLAKQLAQEVDEHKSAHADAMREKAEHAAQVRALTEEKSLNVQTMQRLVKENDELEADVAELRTRIERMSEDAQAHAEGEDVATHAEEPAAPVVPEPPQPPTAPVAPPAPLTQTQAQAPKSENPDFQNGLLAAAGNLKKAPAAAPKPKDARQEMLTAIQSQNITLKVVRKSMINKKAGDSNDSTNIVGMLARALLARRKDITEDEEAWQ